MGAVTQLTHRPKGTVARLASWATTALVPDNVKELVLRRATGAGPRGEEDVQRWSRAYVMEGPDAWADEVLSYAQDQANDEAGPVGFYVVSTVDMEDDGVVRVVDMLRHRIVKRPLVERSPEATLIEELRAAVKEKDAALLSMTRQVMAGAAQSTKLLAAQQALITSMLEERGQAIDWQREALAVQALAEANGAKGEDGLTAEERRELRRQASEARMGQLLGLGLVKAAGEDAGLKQMAMAFVGMAKGAEEDARSALSGDHEED